MLAFRVNTVSTKLRKLRKRYQILLFSLLAALVLLLIVPAPDFEDVPYSTVLEASDGTLLGARIAADGQWRFPLSTDVPNKFSQSIVHFEDEYFYQHLGVNPVSLWKAFVQNIRQKAIKRGGSTISMQVVRLSRKNQPRTVPEKLLEILMATKMEMLYSKEEILQMYSAHAPFGGNVVGLSAASWRYYGRPPSQLSWSECATLAVLPNSPSLIYPGKNSKFLARKRDRLLDKLVSKEILTPSEAKLAKAEALPGLPKPLPEFAPHLLNRAMADGYEGKIVQTTLDATLQAVVNEKVQNYHKLMRENYIHNAAVLVVDIETGNALSYVGNVESGGDHGQHVDIISSNRSTGSLLKPILYAAAIDEGVIMPKQLLPDVPVFLQGFAPQNFDKKFHGAVSAEKALARSYNVPFVHLLQDYGYEKFHQKLKYMGLQSLDKPAGHYGLSMILGGAESTLWEVTSVYASMARSLKNYFRRQVGKQYSQGDYHSNRYQNQEPQESTLYHQGVLSVGAISHMLQAMQELNRPEEQAGWEHYTSSKDIAWKTGTSYGFKDAWAIGLNSKYVVGVWIGNADGEGRPELVGVKAAAPLLFDVFARLPKSQPLPVPLDNQKTFTICSRSGYKAGKNCEQATQQLLPENAARGIICPYHRVLHLDKTESYQVNSDCYPVNSMRSKSWFILPPAEAWYYKQYHPNYAEPPALLAQCREKKSGNDQMELIYPRNFTRVYVPTELDGSPGSAIFEVAHRSPDARVFWHLDDQYLGETIHKHQMGLNPTKGNHKLHLVDDQGRELKLAFEVISDRK